MDGNRLATLMNKGFAKAGQKLGVPYQIVRPQSSARPLDNEIGCVSAAFNSEDWTFVKPNKYGKATWYGSFDATDVLVGDYLVGPQGPFFVAGLQLTLTQLVVACNRSVVVMRGVATEASVGIQPYSGDSVDATLSVDTFGERDQDGGILNGWPCSILIGRKQHKSESGLPSSGYDQTGIEILLPASLPGVIASGDTLLDDLGERYVISGAENTDLGWRCVAIQVHL